MILALDIIIFFLTIGSILGVESALYSIPLYVAASRTLDFLLHGIGECTAITVILARSGSILSRIIGQPGRGVTVYKDRGGKSGADQNVLLYVVTRSEIGGVGGIVSEFDEKAFVIVHPPTDVRGNVEEWSVLH